MLDPVKIPGYPLGIANVPSDTDLPEGSLSDALNVDLDNAGNIISRPGQTLQLSGAFSNLWKHPSLPYAFCVKDGALSRIDADLSVHTLQADVSGSLRYCLHNDTVFWVAGNNRGAVRNGVALASWGLPVPPAPLASASTNGGLFEGDYLLAYVYLDASGMESGASRQTLVTVTDNGLIQLSQVPTSSYAVRVYLSPVNGDVLYSATDIPIGVSSWALGSSEQGKALATEYMVGRPPDGTAIASYRGRVYVASGNILAFSEAGNPHLFHRLEGYFQHPEPITMLAPVDDGLFIASKNRTWFRQGADPTGDGMQLRLVSERGTPAGNPTFIPSAAFSGEPTQQSLVPCWLDSQGDFCVGRPGGIIIQPVRGRFRATAGYQQSAGAYWINARHFEQVLLVGRY
jgi:hypothetical protein